MCLVLLLLLVPSVLAKEPTPTERTAALATPGVMFIMSEVLIEYAYPDQGRVQTGIEIIGSRGSGFAVRPDGYIVTNAHVVTVDKEEVRQQIIDKLSLGNVDVAQFLRENLQITNIQSTVRVQSGVVAPGPASKQAAWPAEIKRIGAPYPGKDVAILKVEQDNLPTVQLGDPNQLEIGSTILPIGYPGAADVTIESQLEPTVTQGIVSAMKQAPAGWPLIQIDAAISPGSSGGPVFALDGTVMGIATLGSAQTQGFNWIVPSTVIQEFLNEINIKNQKGVIDKIYETGLDYYWSGSYSKAIAEFNKVHDLSPRHAPAQDYIAKSRRAIELEGETLFSAKNIAMASGIALLFLVILILVYFVVKEEKVIKKEERVIRRLARAKHPQKAKKRR